MYFKIFIMVVMLFTVFSIIYYYANEYSFTSNLKTIRKTLYLIIVLSIGIGLYDGYININPEKGEWTACLFVLLSGIVIDLTILLTPNIKKLGNAEFVEDQNVDKIVRENAKSFSYATARSTCLMEIMQDVDIFFENVTLLPTNFTEYKDKLYEFIEPYIKAFNYQVEIFEFTCGGDEQTQRRDIGRILDRFVALKGETLEKDKKLLLDELMLPKAKSISPKITFIPIFGNSYNMMICLFDRSENLMDVDATNIIIMVSIFNWRML